MIKLYKLIGFCIDFLIVIFLFGFVGGGMIQLFFKEPTQIFANPIFLTIFAIITIYITLWLFGSYQKENTIGKKISKKIVKDEEKKVKIIHLIFFLILLSIVAEIIEFIIRTIIS